MTHTKKLIVILGQTATGKSNLGVELAKEFAGGIISADSRQVYRGMDIGTGKITQKEMRGTPHYLLDVASPKRRFTVEQYQKKAYEAIDNTDNLSFLVGGSPLYIYAVTDGWIFPKIKPDRDLRTQLKKETTEELFKQLQAKDPSRAATIEPDNRRRLIRALEIVASEGSVPQLEKNPRYECLFLGLQLPKEELTQRITTRLDARLNAGMIDEVRKLRKSGISWEKLESFGLEYRHVALFLQKKVTQEEMRENLLRDITRFARRQMTWFKKDDRIHWLSNTSQKQKSEAHRLITSFIG